MKVLVIPTWYPNGEDKLMGIYHKEFTCALNKYGVDADILFIDRQRLSKPFKYLFMKKRETIEEGNYRVYIHKMLNLGPIGFDIQMKSYTKKLERAFKKYLKTNPKPDILHAQVTVPAGYAAVKLGEKYDIPVVITEHGGLLERFFKDEPYKKYGLYALEHSVYSTVSNYLKDIAQKYKEEVHVLPNQVNTDLFKNDKKRKITGEFRLITVCALRESKRLDIAFKAIKKLISEGLNIHYDIIGDGFCEDAYKQSAIDEGVYEYVAFLGRKTKEEIPPFLEKAHALLISSEIESFAIPGIEALASGIPVITTKCLGPTEFVDESCGSISEVNDPEDLARAIKEVYKNYPKYDKKYMEKVANRYSEREVVNKAKKIYEMAMKMKKN